MKHPLRSPLRLLLAMPALVAAFPVQALLFDWDIGSGVSGKLNTYIYLGASWRLEDRADHLIAKANLDPHVCDDQSCQGVFQADIAPNASRLNRPGAFSNNIDNGNLSYDKHDITSGLLRITQDLTLAYEEYGLFLRTYAFYDEVNNDFVETRPNLITRNTVASGPPGVPVVGVNTFGPGDKVMRKRRNRQVLDEIGADYDLLDAYVWGFFPLGERELQLRLGQQTVSWGESTVAVINSINQINPVNVNNLFRIGASADEFFVPVGLLYGAIDVIDNLGFEFFYEYDWEPVILPAPGSFLSFVDIGSNNAIDHANISYGSSAEVGAADIGFPTNNPLSLLTNTNLRIERRPDNEPEEGGQFGFALRYFAEWLNDGTELAFYAMRYHSRLPYVSFYSTDASCARREGNELGIDATDTVTFLLTCPDLPLVHPTDPAAATDDAGHLGSAQFRLDYPEDIDLYGISFNTSFGDLALQGEVAYRPDLPMQVDLEDLTQAAFGPVFSRCHDPNSGPLGTGCAGTTTSGPDSFSLGAPIGGDMVGSARSFPNFIMPYRGIAQGENAPNSYIRGWESFSAYQFNLGGTYVAKTTFLWMDQAVILFEVAATWVPNMPDSCELSLEGPGTFSHASRGVDGTGSPGFGGHRCDPPGQDYIDGPDGLRFNPTQQIDGYPTELSWGYRLILNPRWESILPGISAQSIIIFSDDVRGTSPEPAGNFLEGRQSLVMNNELRFGNHWSLNLGYVMFRGGEPFNLISDRDHASLWVRYNF